MEEGPFSGVSILGPATGYGPSHTGYGPGEPYMAWLILHFKITSSVQSLSAYTILRVGSAAGAVSSSIAKIAEAARQASGVAIILIDHPCHRHIPLLHTAVPRSQPTLDSPLPCPPQINSSTRMQLIPAFLLLFLVTSRSYPMDSLADSLERSAGTTHHSHWPHLKGMDAEEAIKLLKVVFVLSSSARCSYR